ncbi:Neuromedin-B receptor [Holothuria leucospilota]|uniref:Neuromedin-B receptor n=1 Tax=Holothuria leucospilota TaxID=206669 RepID=A0A9Q1GYT4_HOLLE|nr:Neuromedin-B receptor [Holothuria leucospilota]
MKIPTTVDMTSIYNNTTEDYMYTQEATSVSFEPSQGHPPLYLALLYIIFIVGVPANVSIIFLVLTVKQLRNLSNLILCLICTGDFLMIAVIVPYELSLVGHNENMVILSLHLGFIFFICGLSIFSLVMLSYDRHKAVTSPLQAEQTFMSNAIKVSVIVVLSVLVAVPNYFYFIQDSDGNFFVGHWNVLVPGTFAILYVFPLLSIAILYTRMAITLSLHRKRVGESIKRNSKIGQQRNRTAIIVVCLVALFAICWFPFFYVLLCFTFNPGTYHGFQSFCDDWKVIFFLMNSVFDPISIYVLGSRYRHHLVQIYPFRIIRKACCKTRKESATESTMQSMLTSAGSYYRPTTRLNIKKEDV